MQLAYRNVFYVAATAWFLYQLNDTVHHDPVEVETILSTYEDGSWSKPYFDCRGGDIWMMTYTVPFFGFNVTSQQYYFK